MRNNIKNIFVLAIGLISISNFAFSQNNIYAPNTRNLNPVDTLALHTYCKLSKLFTKELSREKCFTNNRQVISPVSTISFVDPNAPVVNNNQNNNIKSEDVTRLENKLSFYDDEIKNLKKNIEEGKNNQNNNSSSATKVINNTIIRYVNNKPVQNNDNVVVDTKANSIAAGMFNTVLSEYAYVYGYNNIVEASTPNTLTLGTNIRNNKTNSVQIGLSNATKLTILDKTNGNKNNGWIGTAGRVDPLNSDPCANPTSTTTCANPELLRVPGKIVAKAFEVNGAADLAENFPIDDDGLEAGHIVEFGDKTHAWNTGGNQSTSGDYDVSGVVRAKNSKKAIGVVSTNPGFILGGNTLKSVPIAFSGRVPVKVTEENGKVLKGDKVKVSINQNGYGAKSIADGYVIGTALSDAKNGTVLILVKNEYIANINVVN